VDFRLSATRFSSSRAWRSTKNGLGWSN